MAHLLVTSLALALLLRTARCVNPCDANNECTTPIVAPLGSTNASGSYVLRGFAMSTNGSIALAPDSSITTIETMPEWILNFVVSRNASNRATTGGVFLAVPEIGPIANASDSNASVVTCAQYAHLPGVNAATGAGCSTSACLTDLDTLLRQKAAAYLAGGRPNMTTTCTDFWAMVPPAAYPVSCGASLGTPDGIKTVVSHNGSVNVPLVQYLYDVTGQPAYDGSNLGMELTSAPAQDGNHTAYKAAVAAAYNYMILRYVDRGNAVNGTNLGSVFDISVVNCHPIDFFDTVNKGGVASRSVVDAIFLMLMMAGSVTFLQL